MFPDAADLPAHRGSIFLDLEVLEKGTSVYIDEANRYFKQGENTISFFEQCFTKSDLFKNQVRTQVKKLWDVKKPQTIKELRSKTLIKSKPKQEEMINILYQMFLNIVEYDFKERTKSVLRKTSPE